LEEEEEMAEQFLQNEEIYQQMVCEQDAENERYEREIYGGGGGEQHSS